MLSLRLLLLRLRGMFGKPRSEQELATELQAHLDLLTEDNIRKGVSPAEARYAARREFGGLEQTKESYRDQRGMPFLEIFHQDLRFAFRTLRKRPGFASLAILTLALGIGVNTTLFTVVHGVLLSPLPFPHPERLMSLFERGVGEDGSLLNVVAGGQFEEWQRQSASFEQMSLVAEDSANLSGNGGSLPEAIGTRFCSYTLFSILGVQPLYGRFFASEDDREGAAATVVLTHGLWKRRYAGDPNIVGKTILLNTKPYTVIGVLPAWFDYPDARVQLWLPVYHEIAAEDMHSHGNHRFFVTARLKPGVTMTQAFAELDAIEQRIHQQNPDSLAGRNATVMPLVENLVGGVRPSLYVLMAAVGCLLLIACLNVANLFVARAATRRRETAVRAALGGSRWRLLQEQLTESLLLTFAGGAFGVLLAYAGIRWLVALRDDLPRASSIHLDQAALLFTIAVTLLSGIFAGLLPAFFGAKSELLVPLKENTRALIGGQARSRLRSVLLTAEVSLTVILLIGAGLLIKSFSELRSVKMGCATTDVLTMGLNLPEAKYKEGPRKSEFFDELLARVRSTPGVTAAGFVTVVPGGGHFEDNTFSIENRPPLARQFMDAAVRGADPDYFRAMDIPVVRGRYFDDSDRRQNSSGMVISEAMARTFFSNEDPVGQTLVVNWGGSPHFEIVGVVGDVISDLDRPPEPVMYVPLNIGRFGYGTLVVRSSRDVTSLALPVQKEIAALDPDLPTSDVLTMEQIIGKSASGARFNAVLVLLFAALALVLAAVGLYGLLSYLVTQRTGEIGIRIALGAQRPAVLQLMLVEGMRPTFFGLLLGLAGGAIAARLIRSVLFGVSPLNPGVFATVVVTVSVVAVAACLLPAWRASRVDPMVALRCD